MKNLAKSITLAAAILVLTAGAAFATPSTQIWIPSTDIQAYKTLHLGIDDYIRVKKDTSSGTFWPVIYDAGLTVGVLPFEKLQMEVGVDYIHYGSVAPYSQDDTPIYFNAKIGTPENSLFEYSPAMAAGMYNVGVRGGDQFHNTAQDIGYVIAAKTIPVAGRISAGWYWGNGGNVNFKKSVNNDTEQKIDNNGVLLSWDRTMSEIDDRLWMAVDYQGGDNAYGALNVGASWAFTKNVSLIVGYDIYNRKKTGGQPTVTTQLDINF